MSRRSQGVSAEDVLPGLRLRRPGEARRRPTEAHRILAHLKANGVFTFATDEDGTYRYHSLFREFLRQKTIQEDGADRYHRQQVDTAAALEARGDAEKAVDFCLAANEPVSPSPSSRALGQGPGRVPLGHPRLVARAAAGRVRLEHPWAQLVAGQVDMRAGRFDDALRPDALALESFRSASDDPGMYQRALGQRAHALLEGRRRGAARPAARPSTSPTRRAARPHAHQSGRGPESECRWAEANAAWQEARQLAGDSFPGELARLAGTLSRGRSSYRPLREASKASFNLGSRVTRHGSPSLQTAFLNLTSANRVFMADWPEARESWMQARELGARYGYRFLTLWSTMWMASLAAAVGDCGKAAALARMP